MFLRFHLIWTDHQKLGPGPPPQPAKTLDLNWPSKVGPKTLPHPPPPTYIEIGSVSLMCHLDFGAHRGKMCFWDFTWFGLTIKSWGLGPPPPYEHIYVCLYVFVKEIMLFVFLWKACIDVCQQLKECVFKWVELPSDWVVSGSCIIFLGVYLSGPVQSVVCLGRSTMPGRYKVCQIGKSEQQVHLQLLLHLEFRVQFWLLHSCV